MPRAEISTTNCFSCFPLFLGKLSKTTFGKGGGGLKNHKLFIKNLVLTFFNGGGGGGGGGLSSCPNCSAIKL